MSQAQLMGAAADLHAQLPALGKEDAARLVETLGPDLVPITAEFIRNKLSVEEIKMLLAFGEKVGVAGLRLIADSLPFLKLAGATADANLPGGAIDSIISKILPMLLEKYLPQIVEQAAPQVIEKLMAIVMAWLTNLGKKTNNSPVVETV